MRARAEALRAAPWRVPPRRVASVPSPPSVPIAAAASLGGWRRTIVRPRGAEVVAGGAAVLSAGGSGVAWYALTNLLSARSKASAVRVPDNIIRVMSAANLRGAARTSSPSLPGHHPMQASRWCPTSLLDAQVLYPE